MITLVLALIIFFAWPCRSQYSAQEQALSAFDMGLNHARNRQFERALEYFAVARAAYPDRSTVEFNVALTYFELRRYAEASPILENLIAERQARADVYSLYGDCSFRLGRLEQARQAFERALTLEPNDRRHIKNLLSLYVESGELDRGLDLATATFAAHSHDFEIRALCAILYALKNEPMRAEEEYRKAIDLAPDQEFLYTGLATLLAFEDHRLEDAHRLLEQRLPKSRGFLSFYVYAEILRRLGKEDAGQTQQRALETAIRLNPKFAPAHLNLGKIYMAQKRWTEALNQFETAIAIDPTDKSAYYLLAQIYQRNSNQDRARKLLATVEELNKRERTTPPKEVVQERVRPLKLAAQMGTTQ